MSARKLTTTVATILGICGAPLAQQQGPKLGVSGPDFTLDDKPVFLLGASLYGALGVEDDKQLRRDLEALRAAGVNWIRVWATWNAFDYNISATGPDGSLRAPFSGRLERTCRLAGELGMVVDVTLTRGDPPLPSNTTEHLAAVESLARLLRPYRNVYFDAGNERNIGDARYVPMGEVEALIRAVKDIDPGRLCTASQGGDIGRDELAEYLDAGVDFICPHRPRSAESPAQTEAKTREYLVWMREGGRVVPVHYQEPFRRGYADWAPRTEDFQKDLQGARRGGAAGWCFHNGATRFADDGRPRRSFDMRPSEGRLFDQLDEVERAFIEALQISAPQDPIPPGRFEEK